MKFSVIIPVYNVAPYLRECLDSVMSQTYTDWEAICVDDGSTDESGRILDWYALEDARFRVVHTANGGEGCARNVALSMMRGEWALLLDADDVLVNYALERLADAQDAYPMAEVIRFGMVAFADGASPHWDLSPTDDGDVANLKEFVPLAEATYFCWSKIYRREILSGLKFSNYSIGADLDFIFKVLEKTNWQANVKAILYGYRQRGGSAIHSAINQRKLVDKIGYSAGILRIIEASGKIYDARIIRQYVNCLAEGFIWDWFNADSGVRGNVLDFWYSSLCEVKSYECLSRFQRLRIAVLAWLRWIWVIRMLCYWPSWLKRKGIHR